MPPRQLLLGGVLPFLVGGCLTMDPAQEEGIPTTWPATMLWSNPYPFLAIEVDHVEGSKPSRFALESLAATLRDVTGKQKVTLLPLETIPPQATSTIEEKTWTDEELQQIAAETLDSATPDSYGTNKTAVLHILYLDGNYVTGPEYGGEYANGVAIDGTVFLFIGRSAVDSADSRPAPTPGDLIQRSVLIHEAGHVLGLVNHGIPMQRNHEDPQSRFHSVNPESVMHAGVDHFRAQVGILLPDKAPPHAFDQDDLADIRAFQRLEPR